jgi:choline kinase
MKQNHNTLILAAGKPQFLLPDGSQISKYEYNVSGKTLIERITSTYLSGNTYLALSRAERSINLKDIEIISVGDTKGALASALIALRDCDLDLPIFITPGDALISKKHYDEFCLESLQSNEDISLIVFDSQNPKYSYVRMLNKKLVEVCEKKVISSKATAGIFYFKSGHLFMECAEWAIMNNFKTNGLFFLAPAMNYAVLKGLNPILFQIDEENYYRFSSHDEAVESERRYINESK